MPELSQMISTRPMGWAATGLVDLDLKRIPGVDDQKDRLQWIAVCSARLQELRPDEPLDFLQMTAADMWEDVASYDPVISAEMEHEAWPSND
jgi:hypothetical protein